MIRLNNLDAQTSLDFPRSNLTSIELKIEEVLAEHDDPSIGSVIGILGEAVSVWQGDMQSATWFQLTKMNRRMEQQSRTVERPILQVSWPGGTWVLESVELSEPKLISQLNEIFENLAIPVAELGGVSSNKTGLDSESSPFQTSPPASTSPNLIEKLERLASLKDAGHIDEVEFGRLKKSLLDGE